MVQGKCPECGGMMAVDNEKKASICPFCGEAFVVTEAINICEHPKDKCHLCGGDLVIYPERKVAFCKFCGNTFPVEKTTSNHTSSTPPVRASNPAPTQNTNINIHDFEIVAGQLKKYKGAGIDVVIPNTVSQLGAYCFSDTNIRSVTIPSSVTEIGYQAFSSCSKLASVTIPESVQKIDGNAFSVCTSLKSVTLPSRITRIEEYTFSLCTQLTSITIPSSVTTIGGKAFSECTSITSIRIPRSVKSIGERAFYHCKKLTSVVFEDESMKSNLLKGFAYTPYYEKEMKEKELAQKAQYRAKGLCQHCGGQFKGLFTQTCKSCFKTKDY